MSKSTRHSRQKNERETNGLLSRLSSNRPLVVLCLFLLVTIGWGAYSSSRGVAVISTTMPTGTPPQMLANAPAREYVFAGNL